MLVTEGLLRGLAIRSSGKLGMRVHSGGPSADDGLRAVVRDDAGRRRILRVGHCVACCAVAGAALEFRGTAFTAYHGILPAHLLLAAGMLLGAMFSGAFARWLQHAGAALLLLGAVAALTGSPAQLGDVPPSWLVVYPVVVVLVLAAYGWLVHNRLCFVSAAAAVACWLGIGSVQGYRQLRPAISGLDYILCGALSLVVAMFISLGKTGLLQRRLSQYRAREKQGRPRDRFA